MDEKIQKSLASMRIASPREVATWIVSRGNPYTRETATTGIRVSSTDKIEIDGKPVGKARRSDVMRVLIYHKPIDEICTRNDPQGRPTVFEKLPKLHNSRWIMIGRLDINSSGLLLFTNHGELAHRLMHPRYQIEREYAVRVLGNVTQETLTTLQSGVELEDGKASFESIVDGGGEGANHWYHVVLKEGRNREVRRMWEAVGHTVSRLHRIRYGSVSLPRSVRAGHFMDLEPAAVNELQNLVGLKEKIKPATTKRHQHKPARRRRQTR